MYCSLSWSDSVTTGIFVASKMQQRLKSLLISDIIDANKILRELKKLNPSITFCKPSAVTNVEICTLSDASLSSDTETHGQTGVICGLKTDDGNASIYHPVLWSSHKQWNIAYSSYGAKIIAVADADDRGYHLKSILQSLFLNTPVPHQLLFNSKSLLETITTLHQTDDYRFRKVVTRLPDSFESR